jgi:hypothetical protein
MLPSVRKRLVVAIACYLFLGLIGALFLEGVLLWAVLCFLAILAVKTFVHAKKDEVME